MEQRDDGEWAHAAGHGGDIGAKWVDLGMGHVAQEAVAGLAGWVGDAVDAHVDDGAAFLDHVGGDELGFADGDDEDVGLTGKRGEVLGAGVAEGDGAVEALAGE